MIKNIHDDFIARFLFDLDMMMRIRFEAKSAENCIYETNNEGSSFEFFSLVNDEIMTKIFVDYISSIERYQCRH
jgi:hypothetical protein